VGGASNGCDSLVTLDLTINSVSDISTTTSVATISANNAGANYQWLNCSNGYSIINGATGSSYTATGNGNYAVQLTENGCVDTTACTSIDFTGISDAVFGSQISVYPNPTNGNFSINLGENYSSLKTTITDLTGRIIQASEFNNASILNLELAEPSGIYLLILDAAENRKVIRLVKQ
jgi:hypothetical protein